MLGAPVRNKAQAIEIRSGGRVRRFVRCAEHFSGARLSYACTGKAHVRCADGADRLRRRGKAFPLLPCVFAVSALFGGAVWAISLQNGGSLGSGAYIPVSFPVLVISFALIYAVLSVVFRRSVKSADISVSDVEVSLMDRHVSLRCLHDSGNTLFDPVSGDAVLITSASRLNALFPGLEAELLNSDCTKILTEPSLAGKMRLIPYSAVGTDSGMLAAFRPDSITVDGRPCDDIVVAISPTAVGGDGFDSLI